MKTVAVALAFAGSATGFAPSFMGRQLSVPSATKFSTTTTMLLNLGGSKKPTGKGPSIGQVKGAVKKAPQQVKQTAKTVQKKAPAPLKSAASTTSSKAKQASTTFKKTAQTTGRQLQSASSSPRKPSIATGSAVGGGKVSKRPTDNPSFAGGLIGSDIETPFFDPWGLAEERSPEALAWFRSAELKHGRICMLAALGLLVQSVYHLPDDVFANAKGIDALYQVSAERPQAIAQILLAIGAVEVASLLQQDRAPGDLGFDPLGLKPKTADGVAELQLKEIKNGRLAMVSVAGMLIQETLTKQGVLEQLNSGHVSPFGDGQGYF